MKPQLDIAAPLLGGFQDVLPSPLTKADELQSEKGKALGQKKIGPWLSVIFVINQIYGSIFGALCSHCHCRARITWFVCVLLRS